MVSGDIKKRAALVCSLHRSVFVAKLRTMVCLSCAVLALLFSGCKDDDMDSSNVSLSVSKTVEEINQNIRALQKLLAAKIEGKVLTNCTQLSASTYSVELEDGNSFSVFTSITALGTAETEAYSPVISVKNSGNTCYWTLDGNFLTFSNQKQKVLEGNVPMVAVDAEGYWVVTCGSNVERLDKRAENGKVQSLFSEVIVEENEVKFVLTEGSSELTLLKVTSNGGVAPIEPTGQLRRPISPEYPAWLIHIDTWNLADPQAIIDLIPADIRPYVVFNISLSVSRNDDGNFNKVAYGYETAKSWLRTCAENNVWAMVQGASGAFCHWPDFSDYSEFEGSLFEEFYREYPNFIGFNYAEQGWGFGWEGACTYEQRIQHFASLMQLNHEYGGYLVVSFLNPQTAASNSGVAMIKRSPNFAEACRKYPENFIACEKFTQQYGFFDMESTSMGLFVSGFAGNYGMRFDQCGWYSDVANGQMGWNGDTQFPVAAGAIPFIEHAMFTGQTVYDGPELIPEQCFKEGSTSGAGDGYTKRNWEMYKQFENISMDIYRKIIDGTIRILSRKEVIDRTKVVVINDVNPTGSDFDPGYSAPETLFKGLYLMDEDGVQKNHRLFFKKTGRYPAIPTVAELADELANSFEYKLKASQFNSGEFSDIATKQAKFNEMFPEEYTSDGMYAGRHENAWVVYNCYADTKTASIPFKYNTCDKMELAFGKYSVAAVKEYADKVDFYLTNYTESGTQTTDVIKIHGSSSKPSYTYKNRVSGNPCTVSETWTDGVLTLTIKHNGAVDLSLHCAGTNTGRETAYTPSSVGVPPSPAVYEGPRQYEAEYFEYKNVGGVVKNAVETYGTMKNYTALGYLNFGKDAEASVRDQVSVNAAGVYSIKIRYMAPEATVNTVGLYINGEKVMIPEFVQTGSDKSAWQTISVGSFSLKQGTNVIALSAEETAAGELYLDNMVVTAR